MISTNQLKAEINKFEERTKKKKLIRRIDLARMMNWGSKKSAEFQ